MLSSASSMRRPRLSFPCALHETHFYDFHHPVRGAPCYSRVKEVSSSAWRTNTALPGPLPNRQPAKGHSSSSTIRTNGYERTSKNWSPPCQARKPFLVTWEMMRKSHL